MRFFLVITAIILSGSLFAQENKTYVFTDVKTVAVTPVKDQARSSTCWSFSGIGQLESEILRVKKDTVILSDMWIVRNTYLDKAIKYARMNGTVNLDAGGNTHDIYTVVEKYGIVPEEVYGGLNYGTNTHIHSEVNSVIKAYMDAIIKNPNKTLSTAWIAGLNGILDAYFGVAPEKFTYKDKEYTPKTFAADLGLNWSDYASITSFTHHPFYTQFALEIPDNWAWKTSYNVPMNDMLEIIDNSINNGYSVTWAADVSEKGFLFRKGFAVVPALSSEEISGSDKARWIGVSADELKKMGETIDGVVPEKNITQEMRQQAFDNYQTTDDHGMVIVGIAKDADGNKFYKVKNSWGDSNLYNGYLYVSPNYILYKTTNLMVNKNGISKAILNKL